MENPKNHVCPVEHANLLVGRFRAWLQDPRKILSPFVREGMTVLDLGCGPGFFSVEMARMVGGTGAVVAVDLQDGMLRKLADRIRGTGLEARIRLVKCEANAIRVTEKVDFALAFYMVHEVPDKDSFFRELKTILRAPGRALLVEPKLFHVSRREFAATTAAAERAGFEVGRGPRLALSWSAVLATAP